jgi:hypothetical protein
MKLEDFIQQTGARENPVVLLEGIRALPAEDWDRVVAMGRTLAERMPNVIFRSGNAEGTDTAFAQGVTAVDSARMQYVGTHPGMGKKRRHPDAPVFSLSDIPDVADSEPGRATCEASPEYASLVAAYKKSGGKGRLAARASYLLRDALKVVGCGALGLAPATGALFYVNADDPLSGGTGHTIRVCRLRGVKVLFQDEWMQWEGVGQR